MEPTSSNNGDGNNEFKREVKPFGNGAHVTLPGELVGDTVIIKHASETTEIKHPMTTETIKETFEGATRKDFTVHTRKQDNYPRECEYRYTEDPALTITVSKDFEYEGTELIEEELGRVTHLLHEPTVQELQRHTEWATNADNIVVGEDHHGDTVVSPGAEVLPCVDPSVRDIIAHPAVGYGDVYRYTVRWRGEKVAYVWFRVRPARNGELYVPLWREFTSLSDYRSSLGYVIALLLSDVPREEYDTYLRAMTERGVGWGGGEDSDLTRELSHEETLKETRVCQPYTHDWLAIGGESTTPQDLEISDRVVQDIFESEESS